MTIKFSGFAADMFAPETRLAAEYGIETVYCKPETDVRAPRLGAKRISLLSDSS